MNMGKALAWLFAGVAVGGICAAARPKETKMVLDMLKETGVDRVILGRAGEQLGSPILKEIAGEGGGRSRSKRPRKSLPSPRLS